MKVYHISSKNELTFPLVEGRYEVKVNNKS